MGSHTNVLECAKAYLANQPSPWLDIAKALCREVSTWGSRQIDEVGGSVTEAEIADIILPEILSPTLVTLIAGSDSPNAAQQFITMTIDDLLKNVPIDFRSDLMDWGYDSLGITGRIGKGKDHFLDIKVKEVDLLDGEGGYPEQSVLPANVLDQFYNQWELDETISNFLEESNIARIIEQSSEPRGTKSDSAFRLEIIDVALYQALIKHPELLRTINWRTFEKLLADVLESFGYEIELQRGTKDGGVDLFAVKRSDTFGPQRYLLQAKRWSNKVGIEPVQQLAFLHSQLRATKACLATTATFTRGAWELANQYKWQIELRDFDGVMEWVSQAATIKTSF